MAQKVIKVRNKVKYDTEANWAKSDPVLLAGELAVSSDRNNRIKVGDGTNKWSALSFSGLKVGSNITLANDTISITKTNVTSALGYTPPTTNTTYNDVTQSAHGLMTAADKKKLDGIASGANKITVDSSMSTSSTNPVQNKVIKTELDKKMNIEATALTNENLNDIMTYGFYFGGGFNTVTNKPEGIDGFGLHVYRSAGGYVIQELTGANINDRSKYIRQYNAGTWTTWLTEAIFSDTPVDGKIVVTYGTEGKVKSSSYTIASSVPANAKFTDTVYTHPSYTAKAAGLYKVTVDDKGHVSAATAVTKGDITALGIPSSNTDTHYTTGLKVGASATATANAAATNGNVFLNVIDNTTIRDSHKVVGSGATSVTSDANGNITISSSNTTYNDATQSAHGLMTAADKKKLDGIASGANAYTHPSATAYASGLYKITTNALGHVSAATAVTKSDITALGIPGQDTDMRYRLVVGESNSSGSVHAATNGNVCLKLMENSDLHNGYVIKGTGATSVTSDSQGNITINSTNTVYTHPSYTAKSSGLYKVTVDDKGHVSAATAVTKSDITALGIPSQDTNTHYTTKLIAGASATATANAATTATNNAVYLNLMDDSTIRNSHKITGGGQTSVYSDANGNITINTTILAAATNRAGLMTAQDKTDLNRLHDTVYSATQPTRQNIGDYWVKLEG